MERACAPANVLAILTDTVFEAEKAGLMQRLPADESLTQSTYYFSYYLLEALRDAGLGDRYIEQLEPWYEGHRGDRRERGHGGLRARLTGKLSAGANSGSV